MGHLTKVERERESSLCMQHSRERERECDRVLLTSYLPRYPKVLGPAAAAEARTASSTAAVSRKKDARSLGTT